MTSSTGSILEAAERLPDFGDVEAAAACLAGHAVRTPLLEYPDVNAALGGRLLIKPEVLQRTGSFKFRGAFNRISRIPERARPRGVVAYSSGNHAQGVALAAKLLGVPAKIVMPSDAPAIKLASTRAHGAEIVLYDRVRESREEIAERLAAGSGATLVRPYDDPFIIAGQGTCGLELVEQTRALGIELEAALISCGGGGLIAGSALAIKSLCPAAAIYAVEPAGFDDTARSLAAGERLSNAPGARSICDALLTPEPGVLTFALNRRLLSGGLAVTDSEVEAAMAFAFRRLKLVVEPGGAVTLAAVLAGKFPLAGRVVALTLSGGNVDPEETMRALAATPQ